MKIIGENVGGARGAAHESEIIGDRAATRRNPHQLSCILILLIGQKMFSKHVTSRAQFSLVSLD